MQNARLESVLNLAGIEVTYSSVAPSPAGPATDAQTLLAGRVGRRFAATVLATSRMSKSWARRFECARLLGLALLDPYWDGTMGHAGSSWMSETSRRRSGAFSAELLLPASGVQARGLASLDAATEGTAFRELLEDYGIGGTAAAWQLWYLGYLSSADARDALIEAYAAEDG